jgi:hypothetical protein
MTARDLDCSFETCCHVPFPKFLKAEPLSVRPSAD